MPAAVTSTDRRRACLSGRRSPAGARGRRGAAGRRDAAATSERSRRREPTAERDADDEELRPDDPEDGDTEQVREPGEPRARRPTREAADRPEERDARRRHTRPFSAASPVSARARHDGRLRIARPLGRPPRPAPRPGMRPGRSRSRGSRARPDRSCGAGGSTACSSRPRQGPQGSLHPGCLRADSHHERAVRGDPPSRFDRDRLSGKHRVAAAECRDRCCRAGHSPVRRGWRR